MYTINELASIAGITKRTLRHYDSIGLLIPSSRTESNYRLYSNDDVLLLQQILLFKQMDLSLDEIKEIIHNPSFDIVASLQKHLHHVLQEQKRLTALYQTISTTISTIKGGTIMANDKTFEGLKEQAIKENEDNYGTEIRERYGNKAVDDSYQTMRKMSKWQWNRANELATIILESIPEAMKQGISSQAAMDLCQHHQEWIQLYWSEYSREAHLALCLMYTQDERFKSYYDVVKEGAADFLLAAMKIYLEA